MKLTKEALKTIIKEHLEETWSLEGRPDMGDAFRAGVEKDKNPPPMPAGVFTVYGNPMNGDLEATFPGTTRFIKGTFRQWDLDPEYVYHVLGNRANDGEKIKDIDPDLAPWLASMIKDEDLKDPAVFGEFVLRVPRQYWQNIGPY